MNCNRSSNKLKAIQSLINELFRVLERPAGNAYDQMTVHKEAKMYMLLEHIQRRTAYLQEIAAEADEKHRKQQAELSSVSSELEFLRHENERLYYATLEEDYRIPPGKCDALSLKDLETPEQSLDI